MRPRTVERLARVARLYRAAAATGQPPTKTVAERLEVSHSAAANLVARARAAGLLEATSRGRATRGAERQI